MLIYGKGYLNQKGENFATKQDIEEITKKIEGIKSDINVFTENKISFQSEKRKSLVQFYERLINLFNYLEYARYDYENFESRRNKLDKLISAFNSAEARLRLFAEEYDDDLQVKVFSISVDVHLVNDAYLNALINLKEEEHSDITQGNIIDAYERTRTGRLNDILKILKELTPTFRSMLRDEYKK